MKRIAFVLFAVMFISGAQAQIVSSNNSRITVEKQVKEKKETPNYNRISLGLSTMRLKDTYYNKYNREVFDFDGEKIMMKGVDFNYLRGISLTSNIPLYLEVGGRVTFDTYNKTIDEDEYKGVVYEEKARVNILSLSVPINVTYKFSFDNGLYIAPFAGIHFRTNILGTVKYTEEASTGAKDKETYNLFKADDHDDDAFFDDDEDTCKRFQFGGQFGVNFGYKALNLGLTYYLDTPFYKYESKSNSKYDYKYKSSGVALTLGVNF